MDFSSHRAGMWTNSSAGITSSAMITNLALDLSIALVTSFVPFLSLPVSLTFSTSRYISSASSLPTSNFTYAALAMVYLHQSHRWINYPPYLFNLFLYPTLFNENSSGHSSFVIFHIYSFLSYYELRVKGGGVEVGTFLLALFFS